jgi:putative ABC transport system permease protein
MKHALRSLAKSRAFTAAALLLLGIGIGLNTTTISLIDALLYRPAPFAESHSLLGVHAARETVDEGFGSVSAALTLREIEYLSENIRTLGQIAILDGRDSTLIASDQPAEFMHGQAVSIETLPLLGVPAALGRVFTPEDFRSDAAPVVILSHKFWQQRLGGDPNVIGRTLRFNSGELLTVIGIMPARFSYPLLWDYWGETTFWRPLIIDATVRARPNDRRYQILGRINPGIEPVTVAAELATLSAQLGRERAANNRDRIFRASPLHTAVVPRFYRELVWLTYGVSASLLLIACANLAGLQLARLLGRSRELAVRAALGASRAQLSRQFALESLVLTLGGAVLGLLVAHAANNLLEQHVSIYGARSLDLALHGRVLGFTVLTTFVTALFFGAVPAWVSSRVDVNDALKQQSRGATASRSHQQLRRGFIAAQIALAFVLLTGAAMLVRGFHELLKRDLGWRPEGLVTAELSLSPARYDDPERVRHFHRELQLRIEAEPGIEHASISNQLPLTSYWAGVGLVTREDPERVTTTAYSVFVTPSYFETLGIPLRDGRTFADNLQSNSPPQIVINASLAHRLFGSRSVVGQQLGLRGGETTTWHEVIGVVADVTLIGSPGATSSPFLVHQPAVRTPIRHMNIAMRAQRGVDCAAALRRVVVRLDPELAPRSIQSMSEFVARELGNLQRVGQALTIFALLGLGLTALGLYAVMADLVAQRRGEFGIRIAVGAQSHDIFGLVIGSAIRVTLLGLVAGLGAAWAIARLLTSLLPNLVASNPLFLAALAAVLTAVALAAGFFPARRATKVDPISALRAE